MYYSYVLVTNKAKELANQHMMIDLPPTSIDSMTIFLGDLLPLRSPPQAVTAGLDR